MTRQCIYILVFTSCIKYSDLLSTTIRGNQVLNSMENYYHKHSDKLTQIILVFNSIILYMSPSVSVASRRITLSKKISILDYPI